jgi:hypothetical protein
LLLKFNWTFFRFLCFRNRWWDAAVSPRVPSHPHLHTTCWWASCTSVRFTWSQETLGNTISYPPGTFLVNSNFFINCKIVSYFGWLIDSLQKWINLELKQKWYLFRNLGLINSVTMSRFAPDFDSVLYNRLLEFKWLTYSML